jgi:hypothetical protein
MKPPPPAAAGEDGTCPLPEVRGGAEVAHVFVHSTASLGDVPGCREQEAELDFGVDRALLLARPGDVVCLNRSADPDYLAFLRDLGLGVDAGDIVVAAATGKDASLAEALLRDPRAQAEICDRIGSTRRVVLDPFVVAAPEIELAAVLSRRLGRDVPVLGGSLELVERANQKHVVRRKALELGVPVAPGEIVEVGGAGDLSPLRAAIARQLAPTGRVIVRGSRGASGSSTMLVDARPDSIEAALRQIARRTDNRIYLVEVLYEGEVSPNLLLYVEPGTGRVRWVGLTDQCFEGVLAHIGNVQPTRATMRGEMLACGRRLAGWLASEGFSGLVGFDFVEYRDARTGHRALLLAEVNARTNGAAYPKSAIDRLNAVRAREGRAPIRAFRSAGGLQTKLGGFAALQAACGEILFTHRAGRGVLPYNTGGQGRLRVAAFGATHAEVEDLLAAFRARISG